MKKFLTAWLVVAAALFFGQKLAAQNLDVVILGPTELDLCFQPCGTYQASVVGGTAPYTYIWKTSIGTIGGNGPTYTLCIDNLPQIPPFTLLLVLTVVDANGNTVQTEFPIQVTNNAPPATGTITPICGSSPGGVAVAAVSTPNCPLTFQWTGPNNFTSTAQNLLVIVPGCYTVVITNCQGCASTGTFCVPKSTGLKSLTSSNPNPCNDPTSPPVGGLCEKVCPGQTVTYTVQKDSSGSATNPLTWAISGANSYQIASNQLSATVTWGTAGGGSVVVKTGLTGGSGCPDSLSLCVTVTDAPKAIIGTNPKPQPPNNTVVVCEDQTIFFENKSLNSASVEWDFGDFTQKSHADKPQHSYAVAGTYFVRLIARTSCWCADTALLEIYVVPGTGPTLDCIGTVCKGTEVTYSTPANCGNFQWNVSSEGTVLSGGGPADQSITIQWTGGEVGQISLTGLSCTPALCPIPAVFEIPIISDDATIKGDQRVCFQAEEVYEIAPFGGANFAWTLASGGFIKEGQGTNKVKIQWTAQPNLSLIHYLSVSYDNCYLGCGGSDQIAVKILPQYSASGPLQICDGGQGNFLAATVPGAAPIPVDWEIFDQQQASVFSVANQSAPIIPMSFGAGQFLMKTKPADPTKTCTDDYDLTLNVKPLPPSPTGILGEDEICPGQPYTYTAIGATAGNNIVWQFTNGSPASQQGEKAVVNWAANGAYEAFASQKTADALGCESPAIAFFADKLPAPTVSGDAVVCAQTEGSYSATVFQNIDYQWLISPTDAGAVTDGQGTTAAKIFWYKPGDHSVSVVACGKSGSFPVHVNALPEPVAVAPDSVCAGGATVAVSVSQPFVQYSWKSENGTVVSTLAAPSITGGHYEIEVVDANGCRGDSTFFIAEKPLPNVNISTPDLEIICPATGLNSVSLYATNTDEGLDYQWFKDGSPIPGAVTDQFTATAIGLYQVVATAKNGCSSTSNSVNIGDCGSGGGGGPPSGGAPCPDVDFTTLPTAACNTRQYVPNLGPGYIPGSAIWYFGDGATSAVFSPTHTFPVAGFVKNFLVASFSNGATCFNWHPDQIDAAADFAFGSPCAGGPIAFTDLSTFIPVTSIIGWAWDFGDPASGAANVSTMKNPSHTFSSAGNYAVSLTITSASGCTSVITKNVGVAAPPVVTIIDPTANCAGNALQFDAATPNNDIASFNWTFGDPASGAANEAEVVPAFHNFGAAGLYSIKLSVKSIAGCRADFTKNFTVVANPLTGNIGIAPPSGKICEGKTATLTAPPGGISWLWGDGSTANSLIVNAEGNYALTITNSAGCTYSPPDAVVEILPAPDAAITALEKNDLGLVTGQFDSPYATCFGDDVFLEASGNGTSYTYSWPSGTNGNLDEYSDARGNLLPIGTQNFTLTITDATTGCTNTSLPFEVVVNPVPTSVQIQISPAGMPCGNVNHVFSVQNPVVGQTYEWNTGQQGASFQTDEAGNFFVIATNSFGCSAESPAISVLPGAPVEAIPAGCLTRCTPDTICFNLPPTVTAFQWFFNGSPIASPNGAQLIATQSGTYTVELTTANGCTAFSDPLVLDLQPAFGSVLGQVWSDVNQNGIIDAADTLVSLIPVNLMNGATVVTSSLSNSSGSFSFVNVPSLPYSAALDLANLPPGWSPVIDTDDATLSGCDDETMPQLLVVFCQTSNVSINLSACAGDSVFTQNEWMLAGATKKFVFKNQFGCDSIITVKVASLAVPPVTKLTLPACVGTTASYNNTQLAAGSMTDFHFPAANGCDSLVQVTVTAGQPTAAAVAKSVCPGQTFDFQGFALAAGDSMVFKLTNAAGCDSTLTVTVAGLPPIDFSIKTEPSCANLPDGKLSVESVSGDGPFNFSTDGGTTWQDSSTFLQIAAGSQTVQVRDGNGCLMEKSAQVDTLPPLSVELENGALDCGHLEISLSPTVAGADSTASFEWKKEDGTVISSEFALPVTAEGKYTFTAKNRCEAVAKTADVVFDDSSIGSIFYLPNAIDPIGSDANRQWRPYFTDKAQFVDYQLLVYDRWGNLIFQTDDPTESWDGNFRGKRLRPGVFVWYMEASLNACEQPIKIREKGDVTIVR